VVGWARSAEMVLLGDLVDGKLGNLRIFALNLLGERSEDAKLRKRAWLIELDRTKVSDPSTIDPQPLVDQDPEDKNRLWSFRQGSTELGLEFGADGRFTGAHGGQDWTSWGTPSAGSTDRKARLHLDQ
jgi:hypothetical protein